MLIGTRVESYQDQMSASKQTLYLFKDSHIHEPTIKKQCSLCWHALTLQSVYNPLWQLGAVCLFSGWDWQMHRFINKMTQFQYVHQTAWMWIHLQKISVLCIFFMPPNITYNCKSYTTDGDNICTLYTLLNHGYK